MKSSAVKLFILISVVALPLIIWSLTTQSLEVRSRADLSATPTPTGISCQDNACANVWNGQGWMITNCSAQNDPDGDQQLCNQDRRTGICRGVSFCCPHAGNQWTSDMSLCSNPSSTPTPTNSPPRCLGLSANPGSGAKPLKVNFACAGYDNGNDITAAEFGFGGDKKQLVEKNIGQYGSITTSYTYTSAGSYNVTCHLRDNNQAWSSYPDYCTYKIVVTDNALTPTPMVTPVPTQIVYLGNGPVIYTGVFPTLIPLPTWTPYPTATATPTITVAPKAGWWSNDKFAQLVMMIIVSGITVIVALMLHEFFDKR